MLTKIKRIGSWLWATFSFKIIKKNGRRFLLTPLCPFQGGFAFFFFIVIRYRDAMDKDPYLVNHECIHFRQQLELFFIFFLLIYFFHGLYIGLTRWSWKKIWTEVCFEREAWEMEHDLNYLQNRRWYSSLQWKYFRWKTWGSITLSLFN